MRLLFPAILLAFLFTSCSESSLSGRRTSTHRDNMKTFITKLRANTPAGKMILLGDGIDLIYRSPSDSTILLSFIQNNINGIIPTDLYGISSDVKPIVNDSLLSVIKTIDSLPKMPGFFIGTAERSFSNEHMDSIYQWNDEKGYKSFVIPHNRDFDVIPHYTGGLDSMSSLPVNSLQDVKNFLIYTDAVSIADSTVINGENSHVETLKALDYDLIVIKPDVIRVRRQGQGLLFMNSVFNSREINEIKSKGSSGNNRLVFAEINLSEARKHQLYWKSSWNNNLPSWMEQTEESHVFKVDYQNAEWHDALLAPISHLRPSYLTQVFNAGFDGIFLTGVEAFQELENEK